jgi:D-3-phosphoglycerate dehydrogenase
MTDTTVEALILDFLDWLKMRDRSYEEALDAWRTSCPRLPVWEEASDRGLIVRDEAAGTSIVRVTKAGLALLEERRTSKGLTAV